MDKRNPNDALDNDEFDECLDADDANTCGTNEKASYLIARLASCKNLTGDKCTKRPDAFNPGQFLSLNPRMVLATLQKEQSVVELTSYPTKQSTLNEAMGCSKKADWHNFVTQMKCGINSLVNRYNEEDWEGRKVDFSGTNSSYFFRILDCDAKNIVKTVRHRVGARDECVAFPVLNRATYVQYRYTPHIQSLPNGGGVYLFRLKWNDYNNFNWDR